MNHFQLPYYERLQSWNNLRTRIASAPTLQKFIEVDAWWQRAPLVNHYLHIHDMSNWPDPWQLISDNEYCHVARALGICYTLHLVGIVNYSMVDVTDEYGDDYILVRCTKYLLNYHPGTVVNNLLSKFTIKREIDISALTTRIR